MFRLIVLILTLNLYLYSSDLNVAQENVIDTTHAYISEKVENISNFADDLTEITIEYTKSIGTDNNETQTGENNNKKNNSKKLNPESVDAFFQNEKYIEETRKSFLRVSMDYDHQSLGSNDFNVRLNAKLALNKSRRNFKLYLSGFNQDNVDDIATREEYDDGKPEIGVSYVTQLTKNIETKYSLGIRSLYPYVRGRFSYTKKTDLWVIEPIQNIEFSTDGELKEDTKLYFDSPIGDKVKFRLEFGRGSSSKTKGMDYSSKASIFWTPQSRTGLQLSQGIYGNTKYEHIVDEEIEFYGDINNYVTTLTFRQNIYRKWLFYDVSPGINFHKKYDFNPNYRFYVRLDVFFGKM